MSKVSTFCASFLISFHLFESFFDVLPSTFKKTLLIHLFGVCLFDLSSSCLTTTPFCSVKLSHSLRLVCLHVLLAIIIIVFMLTPISSLSFILLSHSSLSLSGQKSFSVYFHNLLEQHPLNCQLLCPLL